MCGTCLYCQVPTRRGTAGMRSLTSNVQSLTTDRSADNSSLDTPYHMWRTCDAPPTTVPPHTAYAAIHGKRATSLLSVSS